MSLNVPIIDIHRHNFKDFWPSINLAIQTASFIAIDAELSGLGCRRKLMAKSIEDRYKAIAEVAKTRSVLSLGLSCFKLLDQNNEDADQDQDQETSPRSVKFVAQTFNILTLCNEDYMVEPGALKFLVEHGFDFNKQYSCGVSYYRGLDKKVEDPWPSIRLLFNQILVAGKPLTLHNGLVDLIFLYQNFYCDLPPSSAQFIADISEMYRAGLIDTKYVAEYEARMPASYLEYVFKKSQRDNAVRKQTGSSHAVLDFLQHSTDMAAVEYQCYALPADFQDRHKKGLVVKTTDVCEIYAAHGYCAKGVNCTKSHDPDAIQDADSVREEEKKKRKRRKRNRRNQNREGEATDQKKMKIGGVDGDDDDDDDARCEGAEKRNDGEGERECAEDGADMMVETSESSVKLLAGTTKQEPTADGAQNKQSGDALFDNKMVTLQNDGQNGKGDSSSEMAPSKPLVPKRSGSHRAGFDAFMTGFATAAFIARFGSEHKATSTETTLGSSSTTTTPRPLGNGHLTSRVAQLNVGRTESVIDRYGVRGLANKLYLSGKDYPLAITKSSFTKTSALHKAKMELLEKLGR